MSRGPYQDVMEVGSLAALFTPLRGIIYGRPVSLGFLDTVGDPLSLPADTKHLQRNKASLQLLRRN